MFENRILHNHPIYGIVNTTKVRGDYLLNRHEISDADWERIKDLLPPENTGNGRPSKPNRQMLNGVLWRARTGVPWRDIPRNLYGPFTTIYTRFKTWCEDKAFVKVFANLAETQSPKQSIDSTSAKAHQHSAGVKKERY